jgi:hypothetical protein
MVIPWAASLVLTGEDEMPVDLPLRDIHLPPAVGSWPPAIGWWLLFGFLLAAVYFGWRSWQRRRLQRLALARLKALARRPNPQLPAALSCLLRQAVISHYPPHAAGLTGQSWLEFLDRPLSGRPFTTGVGRCLLDAPYRAEPQVDNAALIALCRRWLKTLPPQPRCRGRNR